MIDDLQRIRTGLVAAWDPDIPRADFTQSEHVNLSELWEEIRRVESMDAWLALSALTGQLLEALVRRRLDTMSHAKGRKYLTMYPAADAWRKHVARENENTMVIASSVVSAVQLRNWASHGDLTYRGPSPMRATQSLALLLCLREAVYPREPWVLEETDQQLVHNQSADWWTDNYASKHPGVVNDWLAQRGMKDERSRLVGSGKLGAILSHVLACGRASQALTALRCMNRERDLRTLCKSACEETFPSLLRNAAYSQVDDVYELVKLLQGLGLRVHSRVLATVLPFDGFTLERLTRRSMHFTVDYLDQCKEADSAVFRAVLSKDKDLDRLPRGLSAIVTDAALDNKKRDLAGRPLPVKCNPGNMGRLLTLLPTETTKAYIGELDHRDHTVWLSRHSPRSWPNYISATWEYVEARQREPLGRALCTALEDFDLDKMSDFIYRCDQFDVLKYSQVQACLDIILRRVDVERPESLEQYIWEAASAAHKPTKYRGVKLAKSELNKSLTDESRYALIGTLAALDERSIIKSLSSDIKPTPERATEFFSTWDYAGVPIWKKYRVVAGQHAANLEQALPPDLIAHVKELRSRVKIRPTTTQVSKRLLGIVERVVA